MRNQSVQVRPPLAKIVVDVNRWNAGLRRSFFQSRDVLRRRQRMLEQIISAFIKFEIVYYIDEQQRDRRTIRSIAVKIRTLLVCHKKKSGHAAAKVSEARTLTRGIFEWMKRGINRALP